ncbi:FGGY family carbohydrate kinase, partial [Salmonella enterica]
RYRLTGKIHMEYSDAASTLLLNPETHDWSKEVGDTFDIGDVYPSLVKSTDEVGTIQEPLVSELGFTSSVKVFAGGGDNACGAIG